MGELNPAQKRGNAAALLPILVFLVLYLGCGLLFEYGLKIEMGFYQTPAIVAFLIALFVACVQNRALDFNAKLKVMANGVADENILTMCLVFLAAGAFPARSRPPAAPTARSICSWTTCPASSRWRACS